MNGPGQKIKERNFASLKQMLPDVREPEYLGLAHPYFKTLIRPIINNICTKLFVPYEKLRRD
jgi:hypothetical protein